MVRTETKAGCGVRNSASRSRVDHYEHAACWELPGEYATVAVPPSPPHASAARIACAVADAPEVVCQRLEFSPAGLSRWRTVRPRNVLVVKGMLDEYGIPFSDWEPYLELTREAQQKCLVAAARPAGHGWRPPPTRCRSSHWPMCPACRRPRTTRERHGVSHWSGAPAAARGPSGRAQDPAEPGSRSG
jgi:hypothetical protein